MTRKSVPPLHPWRHRGRKNEDIISRENNNNNNDLRERERERKTGAYGSLVASLGAGA